MYGVYSRAITKGRNNPDPNIEDLICVRGNQWCIRTQDSIKCKKLYTGLDRRILTCYNNALYPGIAKLVSRLVWEQDAAGSNPVTRTTFFRKTAFLGGFSALIVRFLSFARPHNNRGQRGKMAVAPLVWRNAEDRKIPNPSLTGATRYFRRRYDGNLNFLALSPIMILR